MVDGNIKIDSDSSTHVHQDVRRTTAATIVVNCAERAHGWSLRKETPHQAPTNRKAALISASRARDYSSGCTKGLAISSLPSAGEIRTMMVPRATTRPRERVFSLPSSSGAVSKVVVWKLQGVLTAHGFLDIVQDQIHKLVVSLERTNNWTQISAGVYVNCNSRGGSYPHDRH